MAAQSPRRRLQMFDGERMRDLWSPGDGPGDGDVDLVSSGHTRAGGHPTWKLYARNPSDTQPLPVRVYLDDKACYEVVASGLYSDTYLGKNWPYDFTLHGKIRAVRPNRGRAAYLVDGVTIASSYKNTGAYLFYGEQPKSKKRTVAGQMLDQQSKSGSDEAASRDVSPGPMDIVRMDEENYARARNDLARGASLDGEKTTIEAGSPDAPTYSGHAQHRDTRPLDVLDKAELARLRKDYVRATINIAEAHKRADSLQENAARAENQYNLMLNQRDELEGKLRNALARLETKHRENVELSLALKRQRTEGMVTKRMLEKTSVELQELKKTCTAAAVNADANSHDELARLRKEHNLVLELSKTLYVGHLSAKSIVDDIRLESHDGLPDILRPIDKTHNVVDDAVNTIQEEIQAQGFDEFLDKLMAGVV